MAHRYFGRTTGDLYIERTENTSHVYVMQPDRWWTVGYSKVMPSQ